MDFFSGLQFEFGSTKKCNYRKENEFDKRIR